MIFASFGSGQQPRHYDQIALYRDVEYTPRLLDEIDLSGWELRDRSKRKARLSGTIGAMSTRTFTLMGAGDEAMRLSNSGGIISLIDNSGLKVHGVSYTREEAREGGEQVIFRG